MFNLCIQSIDMYIYHEYVHNSFHFNIPSNLKVKANSTLDFQIGESVYASKPSLVRWSNKLGYQRHTGTIGVRWIDRWSPTYVTYTLQYIFLHYQIIKVVKKSISALYYILLSEFWNFQWILPCLKWLNFFEISTEEWFNL